MNQHSECSGCYKTHLPEAHTQVIDLATPTPLANTDVANPPNTPPKQADPGASNE